MTLLWDYSTQSHYTPGIDLTGYKVEATDGHIGKVDDATDEVGAARIVVNCKPWLIGEHVVLPAGTITRVDRDKEAIYVSLTKEQIKNAPEYDADVHGNEVDYRTTLDRYYGPYAS